MIHRKVSPDKGFGFSAFGPTPRFGPNVSLPQILIPQWAVILSGTLKFLDILRFKTRPRSVPQMKSLLQWNIQHARGRFAFTRCNRKLQILSTYFSTSCRCGIIKSFPACVVRMSYVSRSYPNLTKVSRHTGLRELLMFNCS